MKDREKFYEKLIYAFKEHWSEFAVLILVLIFYIEYPDAGPKFKNIAWFILIFGPPVSAYRFYKTMRHHNSSIPVAKKNDRK